MGKKQDNQRKTVKRQRSNSPQPKPSALSAEQEYDSPAARNRAESLAYKKMLEQGGSKPPCRSVNETQATSSKNNKAKKEKQAHSKTKKQYTTQTRRRTSESSKKRIREEARQANSKRHRKRRKRSYTIYYVLVLVLMLVTGITLSVTVFFNIEEISVTGTDQYTAEDFSSMTNVDEGDNLFRLNLVKLEQIILEHCIDLDAVSVKRALPQELKVVMTPAQPEFVLQDGENYYIVSSGGRLIHLAGSKEGYEHLFPISGVSLDGMELGDFVEENEDFETALSILVMLEEAGVDDILGLSFSQSEIKLNIDNRLLVQLGNTTEMDYKISFMKRMIENEIGEGEYGIMDLSIVHRASFTPSAQDEILEQLPEGLSYLPD